MSFIQCTCLVLVWLLFSGMWTIADSTDNIDCEKIRANRNKILAMGVISDNKLAIITTSELAYVLDLDSSVSLESNGQPIVTIKQKLSLEVRKHLAGLKEKLKLKVDPAVKYFLYSSEIDETVFYIGAFYGRKIGPFGSCLVLFDFHDNNNYKTGDHDLCKALRVDNSLGNDLSAFVVSEHIISQGFSIAHFYVFHPSNRKLSKMAQLYKLSKNNIDIAFKSSSELPNVSQYWREADYPTCAFYLTEKLVLIYSDGSIEIYVNECDMFEGIVEYEINVSQFIQCQMSTATTAFAEQSLATDESEESKDSSTSKRSVKGPKSTLNSKLSKSLVQSKSPTIVSPKPDAAKSPSTVSAKEPKSSPKHELSKSQLKPKSASTASPVTSSNWLNQVQTNPR